MFTEEATSQYMLYPLECFLQSFCKEDEDTLRTFVSRISNNTFAECIITGDADKKARATIHQRILDALPFVHTISKGSKICLVHSPEAHKIRNERRIREKLKQNLIVKYGTLISNQNSLAQQNNFSLSSGYTYCIWPYRDENEITSCKVGIRVWVKKFGRNKRCKDGRAVIVDAKYGNKLKGYFNVRWLENFSMKSKVNKKYLLPIGCKKNQQETIFSSMTDDLSILFKTNHKYDDIIIVTSETSDLRCAAKAHIRPTDIVMDIGCSFGILTRALRSFCCGIIGVDMSQEHIDVAMMEMQKMPNDMQKSHHYALFNIFHEPSKLVQLAHEWGVTACVVDINGTRSVNDVMHAINIVTTTIKPRIIIVKSRELSKCLTISDHI